MNTQTPSLSSQVESMEYLIGQMEQSGVSKKTIDEMRATLNRLREEENTKRLYVLYHANCTDGSLAAYLFLAAFNESGIPIRFVPCQYQDPNLGTVVTAIAKDATAQDEVYIVDFSLPRNMMTELWESRIGRIVTLDHHESAAKLYTTADQEEEYYLYLEPGIQFQTRQQTVIDQTKCGSSLVLDYLTMHPIYGRLANVTAINQHEMLKKLITLVDITDRYQKDQWTEETLPVLATLTTLGVKESFQVWTQVLGKSWQELVAVGQYLHIKNERIIDSLVAMAHPIAINKHSPTVRPEIDEDSSSHIYLGVECPYEFVSAVGHRIAELSIKDKSLLTRKMANHEDGDEIPQFGIAVLITPGSGDTVKLSFRSIDCENGTTAIEAAERVGGGGHVHAAGAVVKVDQVSSLM